MIKAAMTAGPNKLPGEIHALYDVLCACLAKAGIETPDLEARLILSHRAGIAWADIIARDARPLAPDVLDKIADDLRRRTAREPLSRIYGEREFWGLRFTLSPATLDPRPDTEVLVEQALRIFSAQPPALILDLGTGSGCILTALLSEWPQARGIGADISFEALVTARQNAERHGVADRAGWVCGSWLAPFHGGFDLVAANPPYIETATICTLDPEVRDYDPILALEGGADGLQAYKNIFSALFSALKPGGRGLFEIGYTQAGDVVRLAEESGFAVKDVHPDYAGQPRVVEISRGDK